MDYAAVVAEREAAGMAGTLGRECDGLPAACKFWFGGSDVGCNAYQSPGQSQAVQELGFCVLG